MHVSSRPRGLTVAIALIAECTSAWAANAADAFAFPAELAGFTRGSQIDFESKEPGLGIGIPYLGPDIKVTVYVYDYRIPDLPEGIGSDAARAQARAAEDAILVVNRDAMVLSTQAPGSGHCSSFLQAKYSFADPQGPPGRTAHTYLYLGSRKGNFVKVRITYPLRADIELKEYVQERFAQALCKLVNE